MAAEIDWDEFGALYSSAYLAPHEIRSDTLWILVTTARQGHEPPLDTMHIVMASGARYGPEQIAALALHPDRKGR